MQVVQVPLVLSERTVALVQSVGSSEVASTESVEVIEIGAPLPAESALLKVPQLDREALELRR